MIGNTISHYKILEQIGHGGMGIVYKAQDTKLKRTVALKFLKSEELGSEDDKNRFFREAQAAAALEHANICTIYEINQYENGLRFTLGKYKGLMLPGWRLVWPIIQFYKKVDLRVKAVDVPNQEAITKDNISVSVNAVIYYKVREADKSILEVENFYYAISQLAQTTMRNAVGQVDLDELLSQRDKVSENIRSIIDKATDPWGIEVINVELKDVTLPEEMKRVIGRQAEAEREKRAIIIKAEGEVIAANNMAKAATTLSGATGALHLRTLQSLNDISPDQSNTIVFAIPLEVLRAFEKFGKNPEGWAYNHGEYLKDVINSIEQSKAGLVDGLEGRKSLELISAIYESIETGKEVPLRFRPMKCRLGIE